MRTIPFDTEVEIQTNGLRIRSSADPDASVLAAVSTGMTFPLDADAETVDGWVAIDYKGTTGYVSAEYVTTELALGEAVTIEEEQAAAAKAAAEAAKSAQVSSAGTVQNSAVAASVDDVTLLGRTDSVRGRKRVLRRTACSRCGCYEPCEIRQICGQHLRCNISGRTVPAGRKRIRCKYCGKRSEVPVVFRRHRKQSTVLTIRAALPALAELPEDTRVW